MNIPLPWVDWLLSRNVEVQHWSAVGDPRAEDSALMEWARHHKAIVITHDLDFGTMLALSHEDGPSVVQIRIMDVTPDRAGKDLLDLLSQCREELERGALVVLDVEKRRVRMLPLG
jgi:predicted nuclease of predicted toxin-antitoxin system